MGSETGDTAICVAPGRDTQVWWCRLENVVKTAR
jgi:hypothetical protein